MSIKFCFRNDIHRVTKRPETFDALLQTLREVFDTDLPEKFNLQYEDSEGDKIILSNNEDYKLALETEQSGNKKALKIYLTDADEANASTFISKSVVDSLDTKSERSLPVSSEKKEEKIPEIIPQVESQPEKAPEPMKESSFIQHVIEDPAVCQFLSKNANDCFQKRDEPEAPFGGRHHAFRGPYGHPFGGPGHHGPFGGPGPHGHHGHPFGGPHHKGPHKRGKFEDRKAHKLEKFKKITKDTIQEEIPVIALLVKQMLENPELIPQPKVAEPVIEKAEEKPKPVHRGVQCDVCGKCPIVGNRYKCSVLEDYDLCEDCEARVDHPYPMLKIKNESQHPIKVITVLNEDVQPQAQTQSQANPHCQREQRRGCPWQRRQQGAGDRANNIARLFESVQQNLGSMANLPEVLRNFVQPQAQPQAQPAQQQQEAPKVEEPVKAEETVRVEEPKIEKEEATPSQAVEEESPQGPEHDAVFVKELNTIPSEIGVQDMVIYKTVSVKNTGVKTWPKNSFIESTGNITGETSRLPVIEAGKDFSTVLVIRAPGQAGKFESQWRFGMTDEKGNTKHFGTPFTVEFEVVAPVVVEEPKIEEPAAKQYSPEITEKAAAVFEIFPQISIEKICEYIEQAPNKTLEELVIDYMSQSE